MKTMKTFILCWNTDLIVPSFIFCNRIYVMKFHNREIQLFGKKFSFSLHRWKKGGKGMAEMLIKVVL